MRFPNLRYGNPTEFAYYAMGRTHAELARVLWRDERSIRDWRTGRARVPWWVPEILRLQRLELQLRQRQMFGEHAPAKPGVGLPSAVLELRPAAPSIPAESVEIKKAPDRHQGLSDERRAVAR